MVVKQSNSLDMLLACQQPAKWGPACSYATELNVSRLRRQLMNDPEQLRRLMSPQNLQAMMQMQQAMQQLQGSGMPGFEHLQGLGGAPAAGAPAQPDFASLMSQMMGPGALGGGELPPATSSRSLCHGAALAVHKHRYVW